MASAPVPHLARLAAALALGALATQGCIIVHDDHDDDWIYYEDPVEDPGLDPEAAVVGIDIGASVGEVEPGLGAGVFVEVRSDGVWQIATSCDTETSGIACDWELYLRGEGLSVIELDGLESDDAVDAYQDSIDILLFTDVDFDRVAFETAPGAQVGLTMYLDGVSQPEFVYWVGDGIQNEGAPTNPIVFEAR